MVPTYRGLECLARHVGSAGLVGYIGYPKAGKVGVQGRALGGIQPAREGGLRQRSIVPNKVTTPGPLPAPDLVSQRFALVSTASGQSYLFPSIISCSF